MGVWTAKKTQLVSHRVKQRAALQTRRLYMSQNTRRRRIRGRISYTVTKMVTSSKVRKEKILYISVCLVYRSNRKKGMNEPKGMTVKKTVNASEK